MVTAAGNTRGPGGVSWLASTGELLSQSLL